MIKGCIFEMEKRVLSITPIILAGGKSTRMKVNKSFVQLTAKPMIEVVLEKVTRIFSLPPILITNSFVEYSYLNIRLEKDIFSGMGPLSGIHAGLSCSATLQNFIVGCDIPLLDSAFIQYMVSQIKEYDITIPEEDGYTHPLHAIYSRSCLPAIENKLKHNERKVISFFPEVKVRYINKVEMDQFPFARQSLVNVNTREDLKGVQAMLKGHFN
ncbi:MAG: Molybdopterin-guanine dinucleotide biosynthesis protein [Pelosinus sp.]|jgi:molybdopterin-guanine dinucleotide biosynthesis protein A|nr:Molybdopterin-guanine dinucleotide biosynthesis protein [Pelosinus sp.]